MSGTLLHAFFDLLAWLVALVSLFALRRYGTSIPQSVATVKFPYIASVIFGAGAGAWIFGSLNLVVSGQPGFARSVEGAIFGAIAAIEIYKWLNGIQERTGAIYALPLALGVAVGRVGCLLAGLDDFTYGVPTHQSWGWDFGDGIPRHPVQLYETISMAAFAGFYLVSLITRRTFILKNGFYLAIGFYGVQRFAWEFLKPYESLIAGLTLFHLLSILLVIYAGTRIWQKS